MKKSRMAALLLALAMAISPLSAGVRADEQTDAAQGAQTYTLSYAVQEDQNAQDGAVKTIDGLKLSEAKLLDGLDVGGEAMLRLTCPKDGQLLFEDKAIRNVVYWAGMQDGDAYELENGGYAGTVYYVPRTALYYLKTTSKANDSGVELIVDISAIAADDKYKPEWYGADGKSAKLNGSDDGLYSLSMEAEAGYLLLCIGQDVYWAGKIEKPAEGECAVLTFHAVQTLGLEQARLVRVDENGIVIRYAEGAGYEAMKDALEIVLSGCTGEPIRIGGGEGSAVGEGGTEYAYAIPEDVKIGSGTLVVSFVYNGTERCAQAAVLAGEPSEADVDVS